MWWVGATRPSELNLIPDSFNSDNSQKDGMQLLTKVEISYILNDTLFVSIYVWLLAFALASEYVLTRLATSSAPKTIYFLVRFRESKC